jgi:hypothetical protein
MRLAVREDAEGRPMSEAQAFHDLIQRVRSGDEDGVTEIVRLTAAGLNYQEQADR